MRDIRKLKTETVTVPLDNASAHEDGKRCILSSELIGLDLQDFFGWKRLREVELLG